MLNFEITGLEKVKNNLEKKQKMTKKLLAKGVAKSALLVESAVKNKVARGSRTGKIYGNHRASAPGEPPKTDTGNLVSSVSNNQTSDFEYNVVAVADYAYELEYGSFKVAPRPFFMKSLRENEKKIVMLFSESLNKGMKA